MSVCRCSRKTKCTIIFKSGWRIQIQSDLDFSLQEPDLEFSQPLGSDSGSLPVKHIQMEKIDQLNLNVD